VYTASLNSSNKADTPLSSLKTPADNAALFTESGFMNLDRFLSGQKSFVHMSLRLTKKHSVFLILDNRISNCIPAVVVFFKEKRNFAATKEYP
jgi:hypothetical protein